MSQKIKRAIKRTLFILGLLPDRSVSVLEYEEIIHKNVKKGVTTVLPYLAYNSVFIDVGANLGTFTENLTKKKPGISAHLFEPVPEYYNFCVKKFTGNKKIVVNKLALSNEKGEVDLWIDKENLGWNTMIEEQRTYMMDKISVQAKTFDDYVKEHKLKKIDVIKIDVEGAEFKVLMGMRKTLKSLVKKPVIFVEVGWGSIEHPNWDKEVKSFEWLFANGYQRFNYNNLQKTTDIAILPK